VSGVDSLAAATLRGWRGLTWYLREFTGEARWDEHLAHCRATGHQPLTRREFERRRSDAAGHDPAARCC
jgi:uncharacterized short protein YbdD (DUF466 family)